MRTVPKTPVPVPKAGCCPRVSIPETPPSRHLPETLPWGWSLRAVRHRRGRGLRQQ
ncbi:hypothetical protein EI555_007931 [Monodon monoceros]|uniref:Uncharacterized protein n=1 Tax=Monodon monoceros TaxID=40151 RepID=A0A4U1F4K2_MONMO|nr:hypothetical protein EI555_007931 [Monodon monoceros]